VAQNIAAGYGKRRVLHNVSLELVTGEIVGLAGPNGSGKTTLLHCLTGYQPLMAGEVRLLGKPITELGKAQIAKQIAFVPQHTDTTFAFTVLQIVLMGRHAYAGYGAFDSDEDVDLAMEALGNLNVSGLATRLFNELSGGEQQLVLLARAFAQDASLLILDEPLTGLDLSHQFQLMSALQKAVQNQERCVFATFHDLAIASRWCNRLILLKEGSIVDDGLPLEVITSASMEKLYGVNASVYPAHEGAGVSINVRS
jgi:iron complex transport system ATP-binding protein